MKNVFHFLILPFVPLYLSHSYGKPGHFMPMLQEGRESKMSDRKGEAGGRLEIRHSGEATCNNYVFHTRMYSPYDMKYVA
ncbi:hypothetical protein HMPREF0083_03888 [Aneurinibacillus aneurinilyticus ATCC 12856]|uniref:Uncharacterized protein n=1 Tax=Aneurinibacillus aneurinilyticus ATCC 12856 TaxID=649747 RepID=U1Y798_ANEAE|nr:hypothetical protein HMPREF0083_03888 [Aneurinibacillus aneurinilyticus ATCC 12856]